MSRMARSLSHWRIIPSSSFGGTVWYSTVEDYSAGHQILADPMRVVAVTCSTYFRIELVTISGRLIPLRPADFSFWAFNSLNFIGFRLAIQSSSECTVFSSRVSLRWCRPQWRKRSVWPVLPLVGERWGFSSSLAASRVSCSSSRRQTSGKTRRQSDSCCLGPSTVY